MYDDELGAGPEYYDGDDYGYDYADGEAPDSPIYGDGEYGPEYDEGPDDLEAPYEPYEGPGEEPPAEGDPSFDGDLRIGGDDIVEPEGVAAEEAEEAEAEEEAEEAEEAEGPMEPEAEDAPEEGSQRKDFLLWRFKLKIKGYFTILCKSLELSSIMFVDLKCLL